MALLFEVGDKVRWNLNLFDAGQVIQTNYYGVWDIRYFRFSKTPAFNLANI